MMNVPPTPCHTGWTMDPEGSLDLDDALRFEQPPPGASQGAFILHAYIAAPGLDMKPDSALFKAALKRRATRYLPHGATIPLLSRAAEEQGSLLPGERRAALHITCHVDASGQLDTSRTHVEFVTFRSKARYTYMDAFERPDTFALARKFALTRIAAHRQRGSLVRVDFERGEYTNEQGKLERLVQREEIIGHLIVQESMVAANEALAHWCMARGVRVCFRVHDGPDFDDDDEERRRFETFLTQSLEAQDGHALDMIESICANRLKPASYSTEPSPHWALKLPVYMHGTSPLRRVHDLISQMQISAYLHRRPLPVGWQELRHLLHTLEEATKKEESTQRSRFKQRDERRFFEQLLEDKSLSNKQARRAIAYVLRQQSDAPKQAVLERIDATLHEARGHHAGTVPVSFIDVILESDWSPARQAVVDFLNAHESGWKQLKAHAQAVQESSTTAWWAHYDLAHDPVEEQELEAQRARAAKELEAKRRRTQKRRAARLKQDSQDPLSLFNDLVLRDKITYAIEYTCHQRPDHDPPIFWSARLCIEQKKEGRQEVFEGEHKSKKAIKRALVKEAIAWFRATMAHASTPHGGEEEE